MSVVHPSDYDRSQPRVGIILAVTIATVISLVAFKLLFDSYFDSVVNEEKLAKTETKFLREMQRHRMEARASVDASSIDIHETFRRIEVEGRQKQSAIVPKDSADEGALEGWAHRKAGSWEATPLRGAEEEAPPGATVQGDDDAASAGVGGSDASTRDAANVEQGGVSVSAGDA